MKDYYDRTCKIGELAKMFDINVQLLRRYDKEGLLVPEIRNPENNWRSYKYDQIYPLGMIRLLRQLDCSLEEIGEFMPGRNAQKAETFLNERFEINRKKYEKLLKMERAIKDRFNLIRSDMPYAESDQIFVYSVGGMPVEDVAWGKVCYENAKKLGLGTKLRLWNEPDMH